MAQPVSSTFKVPTSHGVSVTAKLDAPADRKDVSPFIILAHGANNDLDFPLLAHLGSRLPELAGASVLRFNFPYVERGVSSPDARPVLESTFVAVCEYVTSDLAPAGTPVFVGGKSLGGRAAAELVSRRVEGSGVEAAGLVILGYPLHKPGEKDRLFLDPVRHIDVPSLFCVGGHDPLCDPALLRPVLEHLVMPGSLYVVEGGDHSLHLPKSKDRRPDDSYEQVAKVIADFISRAVAGPEDLR